MNWEKAVEKFIKNWKDAGAEAVILTGSFASGEQNKNSDIDLIIILPANSSYKERGNLRVDGFLIEYFANPVKEIDEYFKKDFIKGKNTFAHMVANGKILFDSEEIAVSLQKEARMFLAKPLESFSGEKLEMAKYFLWDGLTNLKFLNTEHDLSYSLNYNLLLKEVIDVYFLFNRIVVPPMAKISKILVKEQVLFKMPDDIEFHQFLIKALQSDNIKNIDQLVNYILKKMGGFEIDGWKIRNSLN